MDGYIPRIVDEEIRSALNAAGAVVLRGSRAVGKTESARRVTASELRLDSSDPRAVLARAQPASALEGAAPRLLDEWQVVPELWNEVRHAVDDRRASGQFLLTGSAWPNDDQLLHSGAGRFAQVTMRTMTLAETGDSTATVSLADLFNGDLAVEESTTDFAALVRRIVRGGWPGWFDADETTASLRARSYLNDIAEHDFPTVAGPRRDPRRLLAFLRALAGLSAQPASQAAITRRMNQDATLFGAAAVPALFDLAQRLYLVEDQPAWAPSLRSRTALLQTPSRHLADPSLAAALLDAGTDRLLSEPTTVGFLFESQVVHDLRVYAQAIGARGVFHYRDSKARDEIDAVVEASDGRWIAVEVKLGASQVDAAAANLLRVVAKVARPPEACVVIIPSGVAYRRPDSVLVVPLTVLGP
ncbi:MAG: DUF4143 domain-containing protein [Propionicimonas sp.]|nr:DUF4143 domain-containing protein [Propionicimonas sp.]